MGPYACVDAFVRGKERARAGYLRNFVPLGMTFIWMKQGIEAPSWYLLTWMLIGWLFFSSRRAL